LSVENISPTRINLIQTKKTLSLAQSGRDILERKRDIMIRELRQSIYDAERTRGELRALISKALQSLQEANMQSGTVAVHDAAVSSSFKAEFVSDFRSIMGVLVPIVEFRGEDNPKPDYGFSGTNASLDMVFRQFYSILTVIAELGREEGIVFALANDIKKTQRRVNALDYVLIPMYKEAVSRIELVLEEKEREEFVRTKTVKRMIKERET
jgi:V/A-type H+-transporting ATPase subunit D